MLETIETTLVGGFLLATIYLARRADHDLRLVRIGMWGIGGLAVVQLFDATHTLWREGFLLALPPLAAGIGLTLLLLPRARAILLRSFPIDPHRLLHLYIVSIVWIITMDAVGNALRPIHESLLSVSLLDISLQESNFILGSLLVVGLFNGVSLRGALSVLGLRPLTIAAVKLSIGATLATYGLLIFLSTIIVLFAMLLFHVSPEALLGESPPTTYHLLEELVTPATIFFIPTIVAVGEEFVFRGVLQPMFGLFPTAIFFVLVHLPQNAFHPFTIFLFVPAFMLGWLRLHYGLSVAIMTHALYDIGLLTLAFLLPQTETLLAYG